MWSAYLAIPCVLGFFVLRRKDIPFRSIFLLFGAFILACGTTHLMEAIIFWWPAYRLAGVIKLFTALVSWGTVVALVPVVPRVLAMRSPEELEREIAARKEAENALQQANAELERQVEALQASEERFRLLVDGTKDHAIFMLDPTGRVASWNPGAERIKQYRADEIIGQHFSRFYPAEDVRPASPNRSSGWPRPKGGTRTRAGGCAKDGSRFWANVVITAVRDETGKPAGLFQDHQGHDRAKASRGECPPPARGGRGTRAAAQQYAQLIEGQRERLRVTLHSIGDGVITTDAEGRVTLLNPVAEILTGWKNEDASASRSVRVSHHRRDDAGRCRKSGWRTAWHRNGRRPGERTRS